MAYESTDIFGLGSAFDVQSSRTAKSLERPEPTLDSAGNVSCEGDPFNHIANPSMPFKHCGAGATGVVADLGAFLSDFGGLANSYMITEITLDLASKEKPSGTITGHMHMTTAWAGAHASNHDGTERSFDVSAIPIDQKGSGITVAGAAGTDDFTTSAANTIQGVSYRFSLEHMDDEGSDGEHVDGQNRTCMVSLTITGLGVASAVTLGSNWVLDPDAHENTDDNQDSDKFTISAHQYVESKVPATTA